MPTEIKLEKGGFDLDKTLQSGQTFCWNKLSGEPFFEPTLPGERYYQVIDGEVVIVWQQDLTLHYITSGRFPRDIESLFHLDHSLQEVFSTFPKDETLQEAAQTHQGLRLVNDELLPTLVAFLCSPQRSVPRIKKTVDSIAEEYGSTVEFNNHEYQKFPSINGLSRATEADLKELGLGYRASRVVESVKSIRDKEICLSDLTAGGYSDAHEKLQKLHGVGPKIADCVSLFSLSHLHAFPIDRWTSRAIKRYYPELYVENDDLATAANARTYFGKYAGYAQQYLFHHIRYEEGVI